jgi:hypothetical protein
MARWPGSAATMVLYSISLPVNTGTPLTAAERTRQQYDRAQQHQCQQYRNRLHEFLYFS